MTIQRQYSLPNCTLVLEGLTDPSTSNQELRPVMSLLVNAECHLPGQEKPLMGGREFFESLVTAVSLYAQEFLSGIHLPRHAYSDRPSFISLSRLDRDHHRLTVEKDPSSAVVDERVVDLTTVQLFDLVEAIDQFVADTQTLPFWSLNLSPVPKRFVRSSEPITKQVVPATIGLSGLALATLALLGVPTVKVNEPKCLTADSPECRTSTTAANSPSPSASPSPTTSPTAIASPTTTASPTARPTNSPESSPSPTASPDGAKVEAALSNPNAITDPQELQTLSNRLTAQIREKWKTQGEVTEDLSYRVGVAKNGDLVGYKPESQAAIDKVRQTPLLDMLYLPASESAASSEPIAQFNVVFKPQGNVEVTPVNAAAASPSPTPEASPSPTTSPSPATASASTPEITDRATLESLTSKLYDLIDQNWKGRPPFDKPLIFRVRVKPDGTILNYEPDNSLAVEFAKDTPLPQLGKPADPNTPTAEAAASFKVVFRPSGILQVSPWHGKR
jgi:hypothetical protein